mgnify:CR=1 FL=1
MSESKDTTNDCQSRARSPDEIALSIQVLNHELALGSAMHVVDMLVGNPYFKDRREELINTIAQVISLA